MTTECVFSHFMLCIILISVACIIWYFSLFCGLFERTKCGLSQLSSAQWRTILWSSVSRVNNGLARKIGPTFYSLSHDVYVFSDIACWELERASGSPRIEPFQTKETCVEKTELRIDSSNVFTALNFRWKVWYEWYPTCQKNVVSPSFGASHPTRPDQPGCEILNLQVLFWYQ